MFSTECTQISPAFFHFCVSRKNQIQRIAQGHGRVENIEKSTGLCFLDDVEEHKPNDSFAMAVARIRLSCPWKHAER